jgi:zinc transport system substrate-binding protein
MKSRLNANYTLLQKKLERLNEDLNTILKKAPSSSFFVIHDALQYIEKRYGITRALQMNTTPEKGLTLRRLRVLKKLKRERDVKCLFGDSAYDPALLKKFARKLGVSYQMLDVLGYGPDHQPLAYEKMMRLLAGNIKTCLGGSLTRDDTFSSRESPLTQEGPLAQKVSPAQEPLFTQHAPLLKESSDDKK